MNRCVRYHVIPEDDGIQVKIFDSQTGAIQRPDCWQDLSAYYAYLVAKGQIEESQKLLADSMAGYKPITKMLAAPAYTYI